MTPGLLIAAPRSGSGKTTITLGLLRALRQRGLAVQAFKSGPDYIDTAFQQAASGRPAFNLDSWAMDRTTLTATAVQPGADFILVEGVMGLFDGAPQRGESGDGSSADVAASMGWPVLLVMDVSGQSQSAAAVAEGFRRLRPDVQLAGVILNKLASDRHARMICSAMEAIGMPVLGCIPRDPALALPERHLGLVQAEEHPDLNHYIDRMADVVTSHVDVEAVIGAAGGTIPPESAPSRIMPPGQRIALASDAAFSFTYAHLFQGWRKAGAEILPFSPLADQAPSEDADAIWLPGGYPELHAGRIAAASRFLSGLRRAAERKPIHGECGGYMVLGQEIIDSAGNSHAMAGLLGLVTSFADRRLHLGYRKAQLLAPMGGYETGATLRGHEFHYSTVIAQPDPPLAAVTDAEGRETSSSGSFRGRVTGSFFHLIAPAGGQPS